MNIKASFSGRVSRMVFWACLVGLLLGPIAAAALGLPDTVDATSVSLEESLPPASAEAFSPDRFEIVYDGVVIRDHLTGLLWEKSPDPEMMTWDDAARHCEELEVAGKNGWQLATIDQLTSLVDTTILGSPKLPSGHPFDTGCKFGGCVQSDSYWTVTPVEDHDEYVWGVCFCNGSMAPKKKEFDNFAWCTLEEKN